MRIKQANREAQSKYRNQLTRGHMNPSTINSFDKAYMENTFALANAVTNPLENNIDIKVCTIFIERSEIEM